MMAQIPVMEGDARNLRRPRAFHDATAYNRNDGWGQASGGWMITASEAVGIR